MTTSITPPKIHAVATALKAREIQHDFDWDIAVPIENASELTSFEFGRALHRTLLRLRDRRHLSDEEREMMHWISALRDSLRAHGVSFFEPEIRISGDATFPGGSIDLLLTGGLAERGVAEVKVTSALPLGPAPSHLLQMAGYTELLSRNTGADDMQQWCCLAYLVPRAGAIRVFAYRRVSGLRKLARQLLTS